MGRIVWLNVGAIFAGLLALISVVWYAAPLLDLFGYHPFESDVFRIGMIVLMSVGGLGYGAYYLWDRWKSSKQLAEGMASAEAEVQDDKEVFQDRMKDALATLKASSGGKGDFLYDLPWYVIIGPPGSGKTTALVNSGLKFPLARGQSPAAIAGVGGTRYCDWWFTEDAVLIDTAGRYTTQDSNARSDQKSWLSFLDLLKKTRSRQPINGVIIAISIEDVLTLGPAELEAHGTAIRARLAELHQHLKIDYPVYVLFTKMDLVAGFIEYFGQLGEYQRRSVWGVTFPNAERKNENMVGLVAEEMDALTERLTDHLPDRLQDEPYPAARLRSFGFPAQFATLKEPIRAFLEQIFEPTRYRSNATLRGFYFTSGTQQGTPIDRIVGSLAKSFGAESLGEGFLSGKGRSYFLTDLIGKVIIGEAAWVSTDWAAVRRRLIVTIATYVAIALLGGAAVAAWTVSYLKNDSLIDTTVQEIETYRGQVGDLVAQREIGDRRFELVLPRLDSLRQMPVGYEHRDEATPTEEGFGLSQRGRLSSAATTTYRTALERFLRPRLLFRLEEVVRALESKATGRDDKGELYETFKVYLMLGHLGPLDKPLVIDWFTRDWQQTLYPGPEREGMRRALTDHLGAMIDLDTGAGNLVQLDGDLVRRVQKSLVQMNVADRAYQILKTRARSAAVKDWILGRVGADVSTVFDAEGGVGADGIRVPAFYTYDGFYKALIDRLADIAAQIEKDRWVLGEAGQQSVVASQFETLADDILAMYAKDFVQTWDAALAKVRIKPLTVDRPRYAVLAAISSAASPLKQIFEDIRTQTQLTRERKPPADQKDAAKDAPKEPAKPTVVFTGSATASRTIEDHFRPYHLAVDGASGSRLVDQMQVTLNDIYQGLVGVATESVGTPQLSAGTRQSITTMRATANRFPAPFDKLLRGASDEFEGNVATSIVADLQKSLAENVTGACRQVVTGRYPFSKSGKDIPLADFGRIFAPSGVMDRFFTQNLVNFVDMSQRDWVWRKETRVGQMLSQASLGEFQRAQIIKEAFFSQGGTQPAFAFAIRPMNNPATAGTTIRTDVNGTQFNPPAAPAPVAPIFGSAPPPAPALPAGPVSAQWPGPIGLGRFTISAVYDTTGTITTLYENIGPWSLFRTLDTNRVARRGNGVVLTVGARGASFEYEINVNSLVNPLTTPALRDFNCPATLQ
ncbi:MAG: type VI secretion system membrane subunit TssM [Siculibacillus sp.]|nr:type VI secretion system membrane subunit TssM [Siculibacillus sp.]